MNELQAIVRYLVNPNGPKEAVLSTLVTVEGSSYRQPGARLLIGDDGTKLGSVSGGCLEEDVLERARAVRKTGRPELATYDTTSENDVIWGVGLGCHGVVRLLIERLPPQPPWAQVLAGNLREGRETGLAVVWRAGDPTLLGTRLADEQCPAEGVFREIVSPPPRLVIFGAGDDAQPLARLAAEIGWSVTVADPRPAFATAQRFPSADSVVSAPAGQLVLRANPLANDLAIVMTHHYVHDVPILRDLLGRPLAYLGLLGPKRRAGRILDDLAAGGLFVTPTQKAGLHAPAGLDIGGDTSAEVALSILAEMRATLGGRDARPLRDRQHPIHDDSRRNFG